MATTSATRDGFDWRARAGELAEHLIREGLDSCVAGVIARVPRHLFAPQELSDRAYEDAALPIGWDQTISQPFVVAHMTALLDVRPGDRVLEVGTGSGYQTAVLCEAGAEVYSIEIVEPLAARAKEALSAAGYAARLRLGDGASGWPEHAPYDGILVTAAARDVPPALVDQLRAPGRLVIPLETEPSLQWVWKIEKRADGSLTRERTLGVRFVPLTGPLREG